MAIAFALIREVLIRDTTVRPIIIKVSLQQKYESAWLYVNTTHSA